MYSCTIYALYILCKHEYISMNNEHIGLIHRRTHLQWLESWAQCNQVEHGGVPAAQHPPPPRPSPGRSQSANTIRFKTPTQKSYPSPLDISLGSTTGCCYRAATPEVLLGIEVPGMMPGGMDLLFAFPVSHISFCSCAPMMNSSYNLLFTQPGGVLHCTCWISASPIH